MAAVASFFGRNTTTKLFETQSAAAFNFASNAISIIRWLFAIGDWTSPYELHKLTTIKNDLNDVFQISVLFIKKILWLLI